MIDKILEPLFEWLDNHERLFWGSLVGLELLLVALLGYSWSLIR